MFHQKIEIVVPFINPFESYFYVGEGYFLDQILKPADQKKKKLREISWLYWKFPNAFFKDN